MDANNPEMDLRKSSRVERSIKKYNVHDLLLSRLRILSTQKRKLERPAYRRGTGLNTWGF